MRGRTNIGGGAGPISSTVVTGIVKAGEHISAGKFVECINTSNQAPLQVSSNYNDQYMIKRPCFKLSDGRFLVFHNGKTSATMSSTSANIKYASILSVSDSNPAVEVTQELHFANAKVASEIWVCEIDTDTYAIATMQVNNGWKLYVSKCTVNVLTDQITLTDVLMLDVSSIFVDGSNVHFNSTYYSQAFGAIAICSLENQQDVLIVYGDQAVIIDCVHNTSSQVFDLDFRYDDAYVASNTPGVSRHATHEMYMYAPNKVLLKTAFTLATITDHKETVMYVLTINNNTITRSQGENFSTGSFARLYKIKTNVFVLADSYGNFIFVTVGSNDQLQRNTLSVDFDELIQSSYGSIDTAITMYDENTMLVAISASVTATATRPLCIIAMDVSDLSEVHVLYVKEIIDVANAYPDVSSSLTSYYIFDGFIFDSIIKKGFFLYSDNSRTSSGSTASLYNGFLRCIGLRVANNTLLTCGLDPVFTKYVKNITGVSKTTGDGGGTIQVYIPDAEE